MTLLALDAVQQALYGKLSGDGVLMGTISGVFDTPPQHSALPYVVIGDGNSQELPQVVNALTDVQLELHVWTTGNGRKTALAILNRMFGLLHHGSLTLTGFTLIAMRCDQAETQIIPDDDRVFGRMTLTVTVSEP